MLRLCVQQSRDAGHTWQEIGDLLGGTRQAAFQRFGKPIDPRTGEPMDKTVHMTDAAERAVAIVTEVLDGRMDQCESRRFLHPRAAGALSLGRLGTDRVERRRVCEAALEDLQADHGDLGADVATERKVTVRSSA